MSDQIQIRTEFKPGDIGYLTYMHGLFYDFMPEFEMYVAETLSDFYRKMDLEKERIWLAEDKGKIVGSLALKNTDGFAQLRYFLIDPAYRGIGLGKKLMEHFMDFMREVGYTKSFLLTEGNLKTAAAIYEKHGYQFVSRRFTDFGLEERRYELELTN